MTERDPYAGGADSVVVPDEVQDITQEQDVPCAVLTGQAGTGKTYTLLQRTSQDPAYGVLSSTTGISAVNLGAITLNSLLGYFDTSSMRDAYLSGRLVRVLHQLAREVRWLIVDEMSMLSGGQLDILYRAVREANRHKDVTSPLGILLAGDFAQLPPVRDSWAFEAGVWPRFREHAEILTKVWRQGDSKFLDALNAVRRGYGELGAAILTSLGVRWETALDSEFDGTTILPQNKQVNRYNEMQLDKVAGAVVRLKSRRWGKQRSEWGQSSRTQEWGVPPELELKVGAYVMILANQSDGQGGFEFVNGDCGHVMAIEGKTVSVQLVREPKEIVVVGPIVRDVAQDDAPVGFSGPRIPAKEDDGAYLPEPHYRGRTRKYVLGQIEYFPLRCAWASTVHKSQSLTLDRCQIDFRNHFFGSPAMLYVALSRCRSVEGLRLVGQPDMFARRCATDPKVAEWL